VQMKALEPPDAVIGPVLDKQSTTPGVEPVSWLFANCGV
jgi:hypothetical protein